MAPTDSEGKFAVRPARPEDVSEIIAMIKEMASFEHLESECDIHEGRLRDHLFGERPGIEALVAVRAGRAVGYAIFFHNYSTFLTRPGLFLEDLYVREGERRQGIGGALLQGVYDLAAERDCGRVEWMVLNWNTNAIEFYTRAMRARPVQDWMLMRVTKEGFMPSSTRI